MRWSLDFVLCVPAFIECVCSREVVTTLFIAFDRGDRRMAAESMLTSRLRRIVITRPPLHGHIFEILTARFRVG